MCSFGMNIRLALQGLRIKKMISSVFWSVGNEYCLKWIPSIFRLEITQALVSVKPRAVFCAIIKPLLCLNKPGLIIHEYMPTPSSIIMLSALLKIGSARTKWSNFFAISPLMSQLWGRVCNSFLSSTHTNQFNINLFNISVRISEWSYGNFTYAIWVEIYFW